MEDYYTIQTPGHHTSLFAQLHILQKQGVLCDVILAAEDGEVMAHKVVLMAASKFFRQKLSQTVSATPSRIFLKGISVVELANLVKYIYTGKLLVAKETMDVTLEVSEILELKGVTQGYNDIVTYEQMKTNGDLGSVSGSPVSGDSDDIQELVITKPTSLTNHTSATTTTTTTTETVTASDTIDSKPDVSVEKSVTVSTGTQPQASPQTTTSSAVQVHEPQEVQPQDIRVTELCEDGTTITYTLDQSTPSTGHHSNEYAFEFNPYDKQYMDVSVGANCQVSPKMPVLQKMTTDNQSVTDEQARHQDLLAVAIETLSDRSTFVVPKSTVETTVETSPAVAPHQEHAETTEDPVRNTAGQNGKIESKIVTLNAGTVTNDLGGQTSVYTVALDPSSIRKPLLMPRVLRKKSEKEKQAELAAKMYRKKKAELINRQNMIKPLNQSDDALQELMQQSSAAASKEASSSPVKARRMPRILLRSSSPKGRQAQTEELEHVLIHRSQDGIVTTTKVQGSSTEDQKEIEHLADQNKGEFGQVVNFDSDYEEDSNSSEVQTNDAVEPEASLVETANNSQHMISNHARTDTLSPTIVEGPDQSVSVTVKLVNETPGLKLTEIIPKGTSDVPITAKDGTCDDEDHFTVEDMCDHTRSSASKRKGKVPRRLPLPAVNIKSESSDKKISSTTVRTRKNSRTENSENTCKTGTLSKPKARRSISDDTGPIVEHKDKSSEDCKVEKSITSTVASTSYKVPLGKTTGSKATVIVKKVALPIVKLQRMSDAQIQKKVTSLLSPNEKSKVTEKQKKTCPDDVPEKDENAQTHVNADAISLDMTVESVQDIDNQTESAKRKLDDGGAGRSIKKTKRARSASETMKTSEEIKKEDPRASPEVNLSVKNVEKVNRRKRSGAGIKYEQQEGDREMPRCRCDDCDATFVADFDLFVHQAQVHDQPLPKTASSYSCPVCGDVAVTFRTIDAHMAKHEGYHVPCVYCEKMFKNYLEMKKHLVAHAKKRHHCPYCDFVSNVLACVNVHITLKHSTIKEVTKCLFCNYKTPLQGNLRKHLQIAHELIVVTKQSIENRIKFKDFEEGVLLTNSGVPFDPETMPVPKMSQRHFRDDREATEAWRDMLNEDKEARDRSSPRKRGRKKALYKLPVEEFTKEVMKRHEEYLKKPEKPLKFMSHSLAVATEHPSFPQASPSVRRTKADKIYYTVKPTLRIQDLTAVQTHHYIAEGASSVPTADNEIVVNHNDSPVTVVTENVENNVQTVLSIPEQHGSMHEEQLIVVTKDGKETIMHPKDFYNALAEKGNSMETRETIGVINALLAAGQEVQIQERDGRHIEIQNE